MERAIFDLNLSVEATSLYILVCALIEQGENPTLNRIRVQWSGSDKSLLEAVEELIRHNVLEGEIPHPDESPLFANPRDRWQKV